MDKAKLQWFIDFIQTDVEKISLGEQLKLIGDILTIIEATPEPEKKIKSWLTKEHLPKCQQTLRTCFWDWLQGNRTEWTINLKVGLYVESPVTPESRPRIMYEAETVDETLLAYFLTELGNWTTGALIKCAESKCGKWFIHTSKRRRIFCSPRCAIRKSNEERRKT